MPKRKRLSASQKAQIVLEVITGVVRSETQIREFLKKNSISDAEK